MCFSSHTTFVLNRCHLLIQPAPSTGVNVCSIHMPDFFHFVFNFSRENATFKTIDVASVIQLLPIVLDKNRAPHLEHFLEFLGSSSQSRITTDQWDSFLQFNNLVKVDLSDYEEDGACK